MSTPERPAYSDDRDFVNPFHPRELTQQEFTDLLLSRFSSLSFFAQNAITGPGVTSSLCADIGGAGALSNTFTHSVAVSLIGGDVRVRQRNDGTVRLPGYVGGPLDTTAVASYLNSRNAEVSSSTASVQTTGFAGGAACTQPAS